MGKPTLQDYELLKACFGLSTSADVLETALLGNLAEQDRQEFINRYQWFNLPEGLSGEMIERILYYRGQGAFFYSKETEKYYFLPFTLSSKGEGASIDCYGQYNFITPLQFTGSDYDSDENGKEIPFIPGLFKRVIKEIENEEPTQEDLEDGAVILWDRSHGLSQIILPRHDLDQPYLKLLAELPCMNRTNLLANSGVKGMMVKSGDESSNVAAANKQIEKAAKNGEFLIPIEGTQEFQELDNGGNPNNDIFFRSYEAIDNLRLSQLGLSNGGVFDKANEYVNDTQAGMSTRNVGLIYNDGLRQRQQVADILNHIWGTFIDVEPSEDVMNADMDEDGAIVDEQDQSGIEGEQPDVID